MRIPHLILLSAAGLALAACQPAGPEEVVEAVPVTTADNAAIDAAAAAAEADVDPRMLPQEPPPPGALNVFETYATGVNGVVVLRDRDTGCDYIATRVEGRAYGFSGVEPRLNPSGTPRCRRP